jgi:hypothetical protein
LPAIVNSRPLKELADFVKKDTGKADASAAPPVTGDQQ